MRKTFWFTYFLLFLLSLLTGCLKETETNRKYILNDYEILTNDINVSQPDIYEDTIVWASGNIKDPEAFYLLDTIKIHDINTQETTIIGKTKVNGQTDESQINKDWICWVDWNDNIGIDWTIYGYSRHSKEIKKIASNKQNLGRADLPRLTLSNNNYLSWIETIDDYEKKELIIYNLENDKIKKVSFVNYFGAIPYLSNKYLVWSEERTIYLYSIEDDAIINEIRTTGIVNYPKVNDEYLVWQELESILKIREIEGQSNEEVIFEGEIFFYDVGKDFIVWQSKDLVYMYHFASGEFSILGQGLLPYIRDNNVIWERNKNDGQRVFKVINLLSPQ